MAVSQLRSDTPRLLVVMGVAGCGKTTVAGDLATVLGGACVEGDSFHPPGNIEKMSSGIPLTDEDRWPWLEVVGREMAQRKGLIVGACSALKRIYREHITEAAGEPVLFIHLQGSRELIASRMTAREGHFMPTALLDSQFATLQAPDADELAISIDISGTGRDIINEICEKITETG